MTKTKTLKQPKKKSRAGKDVVELAIPKKQLKQVDMDVDEPAASSTYDDPSVPEPDVSVPSTPTTALRIKLRRR